MLSAATEPLEATGGIATAEARTVCARGQGVTTGEHMNIVEELRAHNRWRCGGDGPATDARRLTMLIDAACDELERLRGLHGAAPRLESANDLPARLREHAAIHDAATSPYDDEQAQWAQDLRDAADELERRRVESDPGIKMPTGCVCDPESLGVVGVVECPASVPQWVQPMDKGD